MTKLKFYFSVFIVCVCMIRVWSMCAIACMWGSENNCVSSLGNSFVEKQCEKDTKDNNEEGEHTMEVIESQHQEASGEGYISSWK